MKVIDTFLWSEPHEQKCLEVKLNCESAGIDEWIAIESDYTFRGEYKGASLTRVLNQPQFSSFKDRIHVITIEENLFERVGKEHSERGYFQVEHASRTACADYIFSKYPDNTRVLVSDVDELIDFSDTDRWAEFFEVCRDQRNWQFNQLKYWWDFDNLSCYPKHIPVRTIGSLKSDWPYFRNAGCETAQTKKMLAFEYAYSFSLQDNFRKCSTFSHDRYTVECIEQAHLMNTWHKCPQRGESLGQAWDFFETIELNENNSPIYVLDNIDRLKVNTINPDYATERTRRLGIHYPHPCEQNGMLGNNRINRSYHYFRRKQ